VAELTRAPIDAAALLARATRPDCGALALFLGTSRDHHEVEAVRSVRNLVEIIQRPVEMLELWPCKTPPRTLWIRAMRTQEVARVQECVSCQHRNSPGRLPVSSLDPGCGEITIVDQDY